MSKRILLLAGTVEARKLAGRFCRDPSIGILASFAGITSNPQKLGVETRFGGFGGVQGLSEFIISNQIDLLLDATHPFAKQIKKHADEAAHQTKIPVAHLIRSPWQRESKDIWHHVGSSHEAASLLPANSRPFLAIGKKELHIFNQRQDLKPIARMIEKPHASESHSNFEIILSLPLMNWQDEVRLFEKYGITHLVARNSGGEIGYSKIQAARCLSLPVIMIGRPKPPSGEIIQSVDFAEQWIKRKLNVFNPQLYE